MNIWNEIVKVAAANGLWALLFVVLFIYQLQDSRKREIKYQNTIDNLSIGLKQLEDIRADVCEIKEIAENLNKKNKSIRKEAII